MDNIEHQDNQETTVEGQEPTTNDGQEQGKVDPHIAELRKENAKWRTKYRQQEETVQEYADRMEQQQATINELSEFKTRLAKFFTDGDEADTDPQELVKRVQEERDAHAKGEAEWQQKYNALYAENTLNRVLADPELGVDVPMATAIIKGLNAYQELNPTADDYEAQVADLVKATVEKYPKLAARNIPARSGSTEAPRKETPGQLTREDLRTMSPEDINRAHREGRLTNLMKKE